MMNKSRIYAVVVAYCGIPERVKIFYNYEDANKYKQKLIKKLSEEKEAIAIFELSIDKSRLK